MSDRGPSAHCCDLSGGHPLAGPRNVKVQDGIAWVLDSEAGLVVVDISEPSQPTVITGLLLPGIATASHLEEDLIYILVEDQLLVVEISNLEPVLVFTKDLPNNTALAWAHDRLLVASEEQILVVDPVSREIERRFEMGGGPITALSVVDDTVYMAGAQTLIIASFSCTE